MSVRLVVAAAASALAFGLYARVELPWLALGWIGLVPWLAALDRAPSLRAALGAGLVFCVAFVLAVFGWFAPAIRSYTGAPWPVALAVLMVIAPLLQPQLVVYAAGRHLTHRVLPGVWLPASAAAAIYVGSEWGIGKVFGDTIGHGLHASVWMRQAADLGGAPLLTFVLLIANEAGRAAVRESHPATRLRHGLVPVALALVLLGYGALRCRQLERASHVNARVHAGVVQANMGDYAGLRARVGTFAAVRTILDTHVALSDELRRRDRIDLLVWPETVYPTTFGAPKSPDGAEFDHELAAFVTRAGVPLVFGAYDAEDGAEYNAAVFLEPAPSARFEFATYRKQRLFPLTERVPALLDSALVRQWLPWLGTWRPGGGPEVVSLGLPDGRTLRLAPLICYDAVDPGLALAAVRRGAEVLLTLSNDSWFASGLGPRLHLIVSAFRSIETRRPQIRATNTGISAVIDATGTPTAVAGVHRRATLVAVVQPETEATTLALAWGDWFGPAALVVGLLLLSAGWLRRRGSQQSPHG